MNKKRLIIWSGGSTTYVSMQDYDEPIHYFVFFVGFKTFKNATPSF